MAIDLKALQSPSELKRPVICTFVGDGGLGKTTLASMFPAPVIIRTESGTESIRDNKNVKLMPLAKSTDNVLEQIHALLTQEHPFKTVVIDSITQFDAITTAEIVKADGKAKSINQACGGYGAGQLAVAENHRNLREKLDLLMTERNMNVVILAHADSEKIAPPDNDTYTRYTIRMHKNSTQHWSDNVDMVGFIKLKTFLTGDSEKAKKAVSTGQRIITCYPTASHISKNRYGIEKDIPFNKGEFPFKDIIKFF